MKKSTLEAKMLDKLKLKEKKYLEKHMEKREGKLDILLEEKVPDKMKKTLTTAFGKAFKTIFEKGTWIIEKTYGKDKIEKNFKVRKYAHSQMHTRKSLRGFSKDANLSTGMNTAVSGISGFGMGVLGIGIPDIVLFTGMLLKNIYEIGASYGFDHESEKEKIFIMMIIRGGLAYSNELIEINSSLNSFSELGFFTEEKNIDDEIRKTAEALSGELLYMKFLQGIPIVGAVGGAFNGIYMSKISKYAKLKYNQRFLLGISQK